MIDLSLLEDFISGSGESLDEMETALLELEINPIHNELLHTIFRAVHTIKGAAQFVGLEKVSALTHVLEDLLDLLREGKKPVNPVLIELLIQTKDRISSLVKDLGQTKSEITEVDDLIAKIKQHLADRLTPDDTEDQTVDLSNFLIESSHISSQDEIELDLSRFLITDENTVLTEDDNTSITDTDYPNPAIAIDADESISLPEEEHDQELFAIYIQQLTEKTAILTDITVRLHNEDNKIELLTLALDTLESLKFSANYMGYESLIRFYNRWIDEAVDAQENLATTQAVSFAFMNTQLSKLQSILPHRATKLTAVSEYSKDSSLQNTETNLAFITEVLTTAETAPAITDHVMAQVLELNSSAEVLIDDDYLFAKLSHALDSSIERAITAEPINEVFSALLAATNAQKSDIKDKKTVKIKTLAEANQEAELIIETSTAPSINPVKADTIEDKASDKIMMPNAGDKALKRSIRVDADKIDSLMNQVGELIVDRAYFFQLANEINELQHYLKEVTGLAQKDLKPVRTFAYRFSEAIISLGRTSNELQEGVMKVRMLPISQLFNRYPRLVHDLAHTNGKKVQLEIRGEETELDKMIIEEISDPLIHMIRNAIGHGIETPAVRKQLAKAETGTLLLEAYHESNHIVIEVTDDGRGIDTDKIKIKAEEMGLFGGEELNRMSSDDLTRFIMLPGFSTAKEISSTSGRGVGMDVVKKNIEKLNGTIEVESKLGIETKIRLKIPLTLAIIQALLVRVGDDSFTIPLANVEETLRVTPHEISLVENTEVMYLRSKTLPLFRLSVLFNLDITQTKEQANFFVVVVNTGNQKIGLIVDALLGQEEVVIKPLVDYLHEQNCFSGATIIGDGRISLILDVYELINMATDKQVKKHQLPH